MSAEEKLKEKQAELEALQKSFDDYIESSKELEGELEEALAKAEARTAEATKKKVEADYKTGELQKRITALMKEASKVPSHSNSQNGKGEGFIQLENENEDLKNRIRVLESTEEDLNHRLHDSEEEVIFLRAEVEEVRDAQHDAEDALQAEVKRLQSELENAKAAQVAAEAQSGKPMRRVSLSDGFGLEPDKLSTELIQQLEREMDELKEQLMLSERRGVELESTVSDLGQRLSEKEALIASRPTQQVDHTQVVELKNQIFALQQQLASRVDHALLAQKDKEIEDLLCQLEEFEEASVREKEQLVAEMAAKMEDMSEELNALKAITVSNTISSRSKSSHSFIQGSDISSIKGGNGNGKGRGSAPVVIDCRSSLSMEVMRLAERGVPEEMKEYIQNMKQQLELLRSNNMKLLNKLQATRGNILVCCRTRPPSDQELSSGGKICIDAADDSEMMCYDSRSELWKSFFFDRVWNAETNQADVFADVEPIIMSVLDGYNCCILAYGQTGSGKTFTMDGYGDHYGVSYRAIQQIFDLLVLRKRQFEEHWRKQQQQKQRPTSRPNSKNFGAGGSASRPVSMSGQESGSSSKRNSMGPSATGATTPDRRNSLSRGGGGGGSGTASPALGSSNSSSGGGSSGGGSPRQGPPKRKVFKSTSLDHTQKSFFECSNPLSRSDSVGDSLGNSSSDLEDDLLGTAIILDEEDVDLEEDGGDEDEDGASNSNAAVGVAAMAATMAPPKRRGSRRSMGGAGTGDDEEEEEEEMSYTYSVTISMLEIYNEQVFDLLDDAIGGGQGQGGISNLEIRQGPDNTTSVPGLKEVAVTNLSEVKNVFGKGMRNRATASTNLNEHSSRSHLIVQVGISMQRGSEMPVRGKLNLVDLAGSERVGKSGATGATMKEAQHINKSLAALGDVMEALDQKSKHVPYRNSKLTYLLQNSLGGNSRTMMIVTVCPTDVTYDETLFTLQFATRVRNISLGPAQRQSNAKNLEVLVRNMRADFKEERKKSAALAELVAALKKEVKKAPAPNLVVEAKLRAVEEAKKSADVLMQQLNRQLTETNAKLGEEKDMREQTLIDLDLTQRNLKKALEQVKEQTKELETLTLLVKKKDKEIESLQHTIAANAAAALAGGGGSGSVGSSSSRHSTLLRKMSSPPNSFRDTSAPIVGQSGSSSIISTRSVGSASTNTSRSGSFSRQGSAVAAAPSLEPCPEHPDVRRPAGFNSRLTDPTTASRSKILSREPSPSSRLSEPTAASRSRNQSRDPSPSNRLSEPTAATAARSKALSRDVSPSNRSTASTRSAASTSASSLTGRTTQSKASSRLPRKSTAPASVGGTSSTATATSTAARSARAPASRTSVYASTTATSRSRTSLGVARYAAPRATDALRKTTLDDNQALLSPSPSSSSRSPGSRGAAGAAATRTPGSAGTTGSRPSATHTPPSSATPSSMRKSLHEPPTHTPATATVSAQLRLSTGSISSSASASKRPLLRQSLSPRVAKTSTTSSGVKTPSSTTPGNGKSPGSGGSSGKTGGTVPRYLLPRASDAHRAIVSGESSVRKGAAAHGGKDGGAVSNTSPSSATTLRTSRSSIAGKAGSGGGGNPTGDGASVRTTSTRSKSRTSIGDGSVGSGGTARSGSAASSERSKSSVPAYMRPTQTFALHHLEAEAEGKGSKEINTRRASKGDQEGSTAPGASQWGKRANEGALTPENRSKMSESVDSNDRSERSVTGAASSSSNSRRRTDLSSLSRPTAASAARHEEAAAQSQSQSPAKPKAKERRPSVGSSSGSVEGRATSKPAGKGEAQSSSSSHTGRMSHLMQPTAASVAHDIATAEEHQHHMEEVNGGTHSAGAFRTSPVHSRTASPTHSPHYPAHTRTASPARSPDRRCSDAAAVDATAVRSSAKPAGAGTGAVSASVFLATKSSPAAQPSVAAAAAAAAVKKSGISSRTPPHHSDTSSGGSVGSSGGSRLMTPTVASSSVHSRSSAGSAGEPTRRSVNGTGSLSHSASAPATPSDSAPRRSHGDSRTSTRTTPTTAAASGSGSGTGARGESSAPQTPLSRSAAGLGLRSAASARKTPSSTARGSASKSLKPSVSSSSAGTTKMSPRLEGSSSTAQHNSIESVELQPGQRVRPKVSAAVAFLATPGGALFGRSNSGRPAHLPVALTRVGNGGSNSSSSGSNKNANTPLPRKPSAPTVDIATPPSSISSGSGSAGKASCSTSGPTPKPGLRHSKPPAAASAAPSPAHVTPPKPPPVPSLGPLSGGSSTQLDTVDEQGSIQSGNSTPRSLGSARSTHSSSGRNLAELVQQQQSTRNSLNNPRQGLSPAREGMEGKEGKEVKGGKGVVSSDDSVETTPINPPPRSIPSPLGSSGKMIGGVGSAFSGRGLLSPTRNLTRTASSPATEGAEGAAAGSGKDNTGGARAMATPEATAAEPARSPMSAAVQEGMQRIPSLSSHAEVELKRVQERMLRRKSSKQNIEDSPSATPATPASATPASATPAPATPASATPASATPASATPASATPASATPAPATPASATPASAPSSAVSTAPAPAAFADDTSRDSGNKDTAQAAAVAVAESAENLPPPPSEQLLDSCSGSSGEEEVEVVHDSDHVDDWDNAETY